jgi:mannose-1-phosphate guanylyltransferase/mannose-6-phosphate isomerase
MIPVILSGGSGTRLWPVSRPDFPKQFCELFDESLILKSLVRVSKLGSPWVITSQKMELLTQKTFLSLGIPSDQILAEPEAKNTAAAIAWACRTFQAQGKTDAVVGIFPADHLVQDETTFVKALKMAEDAAKSGALVTLGIQPTYPATGYGYIELKTRSQGDQPVAHSAIRFCEKPNLETAKEFLANGRYAWNGGIFVFRVDHMIELMKTHLPEVWNHFEAVQAPRDKTQVAAAFKATPSISIDYGVMEKLPSHTCITADFGWSDVGSWDEMANLSKPTNNPVTQIEGSNNYIFSREPNRSYALVGVSDLMVIDTQDALLICKKGQSQKVKDAQSDLAKKGAAPANAHPFENRPWGRFDILKDTAKFKSKVIRVDPGQQLSLQSHAKRAEHWIILNGNPVVVLNNDILRPKAGEHVYIPTGAKHRMRNPTNEAVEFVEVQVGSYFGEDDIVRYQDDYRRC